MNLLDNWYFANPINQRGFSEISSPSAYTIDRWINVNGHTLSLVDGVGLKAKANPSASANYMFTQRFENYAELAGKIVTFSALVVENTTKEGIALRYNSSQGAAFVRTGLITRTITIPTGLNSLEFGFSLQNRAAESDSYVVISAAKLELGSRQTLAHQAEDGSWVLNDPPPDPTLELAKCQRYQLVLNSLGTLYGYFGTGLSNNGGSARIFIPTPVRMRVKPTIAKTGTIAITNGASTFSVQALSVEYASTNGISVIVEASGIQIGTPAMLRADNDLTTKIILDANL